MIGKSPSASLATALGAQPLEAALAYQGHVHLAIAVALAVRGAQIVLDLQRRDRGDDSR